MTFDVPGAIHMHSDYSHDGLDSLENLREVCITRGIRWVGLTDHAEDLDEEVFGEYLAHCVSLSDNEFTFIPGLEFRFAGFRGVHLFAVGIAGSSHGPSRSSSTRPALRRGLPCSRIRCFAST